jgi:Lon protease-like protein
VRNLHPVDQQEVVDSAVESGQPSQLLPLFPLSSGLFPDGLIALRIFEVRYLDMIKRCLREKTPFGVVMLKNGREVDAPQESVAFETIGCEAELITVDAITPALLSVRARGGRRFEILSCDKGRYGLWSGRVRMIPGDEACEIPAAQQGAADSLGQIIARLQRQGVSPAEMPILAPYRLDEAGWVANRWAEFLPLSGPQRQSLLSQIDPEDRLRIICAAMEDFGLDT